MKIFVIRLFLNDNELLPHKLQYHVIFSNITYTSQKLADPMIAYYDLKGDLLVIKMKCADKIHP